VRRRPLRCLEIQALTSPTWHETAVKVAGYILGEYGDYIANEPGSSPIEQFRALHSKFGACSPPTRALLLTTYIKFANLFPEIRHEVGPGATETKRTAFAPASHASSGAFAVDFFF